MKAKRSIAILLICTLLAAMLFAVSCDGKNPPPDDANGDNEDNCGNGNNGNGDEGSKLAHINVAVLKGPTGVGAVKLADDSANGRTKGDYTVSFYETTDVTNIVSNVINGSVDIAAVPINLAATLNKKTDSGVQVICANALGVLSVIGTRELSSVSDLRGMNLNVVGQASTPEYIVNYVLTENGLDPSTDVKITFYSDANAAIANITDDNTFAVIPEPAVSVNLAKNSALKVIFNMTDEWNKVCDTRLIQGCLVVRREFATANPEAIKLFLREYSASVDYVNSEPSAAAELLVSYSIIGAKAVAEKAIPRCNCVCITGEDMKSSVGAMLSVLYTASPSSVGGSLPDDGFYYIAE